MHWFLKFVLWMKLYLFRTVPLSIIRSFSLYTQQWYMSYRFVDSLRAGSGWNHLILLARCTNFSNLFFEWNSTCFRQFICPSSGVFHCTHSNDICHTGLLTACEEDQIVPSWNILILLASCLQNCMTYTIVVCTVKNSWWWTEELSETCRVSFQE